MKQLSVWMLLLVSLVPLNGHSAAQPIDRTVSLDSGYIPGIYTNRAIWNFGLEFEYLGSKIFDFIDSKTPVGSNFFTRGLLGAGAYLGWKYPQYAFFLANHEYGHGVRISAIGPNPVYSFWGEETQFGNIFTFFAVALTKYGSGASAGTTENTTVWPPDDYVMSIVAGGMNNSAMFSEYLEDEVYFNGGHINQYTAYINGKMDTARYVESTQGGVQYPDGGTGDVDNMRSYYEAKGYPITLNNMWLGSVIARWASATHWAYLWSAGRYLVVGDPTVRPFQLGGFKLPDVSHFLNRNGLAFRVRSGFQTGNITFPFAVEFIYKGTPTVELTVGYRKSFGRSERMGAYQFDLIANSQVAFGARALLDHPLGQSFFASIGGSIFQSATFQAERTAVSFFSQGRAGFEAWGRLSLLY